MDTHIHGSGSQIIRDEPSIPAPPPYADECAKAAAMQIEEATVLEDTLRRQHNQVMASIEVLSASSEEAQRQIGAALESLHLRRRAIEAAILEFDQAKPDKAKAMASDVASAVESLGAMRHG